MANDIPLGLQELIKDHATELATNVLKAVRESLIDMYLDAKRRNAPEALGLGQALALVQRVLDRR